MIPHRFSYSAPASAEEAVADLAAAEGSPSLLGGGTWVVPEMGRGELRPSAVIDLRRAGLGAIAPTNGRLRLGATCSYADVLEAPSLAREAPLLVAMAGGITGGRQVQGQGTIGGSACKARPASDAPAALVAQGGEAMVLGPEGERRIAVADFFLGPERNALGAGELLTGFDLEVDAAAAWGYYKLKHSGSSWPIATAAARLSVGEDGRCTGAALVLGGVGERPVSVDAGPALVGEKLDEATLREAAALAPGAVESPYADELATAEYRMAVAAPVALRALRRALDRCQGGERG